MLQLRLNSSLTSRPEIIFANDNLLGGAFVAVPLLATNIVGTARCALAATSFICFFLALGFLFSGSATGLRNVADGKD